MSFKVTLTLEGQEMPVLECSYTLEREISFSGQPTTVVKGGTITLEIESSEDYVFFDWIINPYKTKNGSLKFFKRNNSSVVMKELQFEDAYLVYYNERIDTSTEMPMVQTMIISANKLTTKDATHHNKWNES